METNKEKIKLKINALLAKTTENGASEAEAIAALKKANELMKAYYIDENDLSDPYLGEKCISVTVPIIKTAYDMTLFYGSLAQLFDCFYYYNCYRIVFFGFEDDAKLAGFFYEMIVKSALKEAEEYKKSDQFLEQKRKHHGRTLVASFIKGFLYRIHIKLREMYENRKTTIPTGMGLMLANKKDKVEHEYKSQKIKVHSCRSNLGNPERAAFMKGCEKGDGFSITQGIDQHRNDSVCALTI